MNNNDNHNQNFFCTSKRSMSLISAALVLIFFLTFMTGYIWGKRVALEDVLKAVEQKTFADQISGSLYALSAHDFEVKKEDISETGAVVVSVAPEEFAQNNNGMPEVEGLVQPVEASPVVLSSEKNEKEAVALSLLSSAESSKRENKSEKYYAPLIGFGSKKAANKFVALLEGNPLKVVIKEHISIGSNGKKRAWYQVVTQQYTNKEELEQLVAHVVKKEHLSGVSVLVC